MFKQTTCIRIENTIVFKMFVMQTAATVLFICEQRSPSNQFSPGVRDGEEFDPIAVRLSAYENWAEHGYTNALQASVEFLHDFMQMVIDDPHNLHLFLFEQGEIRLLTDALLAYQEWKTAKVFADKARHGPHWGDAMSFNSKDWTDLTGRFLALFEE